MPKVPTFSDLPTLDKAQGQSGAFNSSDEKAKALANSTISRELAQDVEGSSRYSRLGRALAAFGLSDSPSQLGVIVVMPVGSKPGFDRLRDMWDEKTGSLRDGYGFQDLEEAARDAHVRMVYDENGITNSPSQAYSNSLSLSMENTALRKDVIVVSAYNPTASKMIDGVEAGMIKMGTNTATVEAARSMITRVVAYNESLAKQEGDPTLAYTQVWGHSEGAAIDMQALLEGMSPSVLAKVDARFFGNPMGVAPAGLHSFMDVGNVNDNVAQMGRKLTFSGGVENSKGFIDGNTANPGSYQYVPANFVVDARGEWNHSWQYYFSDSTTRSAFGLAEMDANLKEFYSHSYWKEKE